MILLSTMSSRGIIVPVMFSLQSTQTQYSRPAKIFIRYLVQHPWMAENGVASDTALENEIQQRLKKFQGLNKLKRQALKLIATYMAPEEVSGLRNQFHALDKDGNGVKTAALMCTSVNAEVCVYCGPVGCIVS